MINLLSNSEQIEAAVLLQKQILKIFYALIQYTMPLALINADNFAIWMDIICRILEKEIPDFVTEYDECDRNECAWWKVKKWCCHITSRIFCCKKAVILNFRCSSIQAKSHPTFKK